MRIRNVKKDYSTWKWLITYFTARDVENKRKMSEKAHQQKEDIRNYFRLPHGADNKKSYY